LVDLSSPRILVIGATGPLGRDILTKAAAAGLSFRALARKPEALADFAGRHEILRGDVTDPASLDAALQGVEGVICALGTKLTRKPVTLLSEGTKNIVAAMRGAGAARLICVTGMGAGDSRGHGGFLYDRIVLPLLLGRIYEDKDRQEAILRASGLDWLIVRPAMLTDGPEAGRWRELTALAGERMTRISRGDVAQFLVGEARTPKYSRVAVNLSE